MDTQELRELLDGPWLLAETVIHDPYLLYDPETYVEASSLEVFELFCYSEATTDVKRSYVQGGAELTCFGSDGVEIHYRVEKVPPGQNPSRLRVEKIARWAREKDLLRSPK